MAYRQAELFVTFLLMNAILDDHPFAEAVTADYEPISILSGCLCAG
jgi:hypothetical protein